jgi:CrcB protein
MKLLLLASVGGAVGAGMRHLVNVAFGRLLGAGYPWATLFVNVAGCLAMGILIELLAQRFNGSLELRTLLATGVLGGFTTFSSFALDFSVLMQRGEMTSAALYAVVSVIASILALYAGMAIMRAWLT